MARWFSGLIRRLEQFPTSVAALMSGASLVVSIIALLLPTCSGPPDPAPIEQLIVEEAALTKSKKTEQVVGLFVPDAVVRDLGVPYEDGQVRRRAQSWVGRDAIHERYRMIEERADFEVLEHLNVTVVFGSSGRHARGRSSTEATMRWDKGAPQHISTQGAEDWEFEKTAAGWRIKSFTYHGGGTP